MRNRELKIQVSIFWLDSRKHFLTAKAISQWKKLSQVVGYFPSVKVVKQELDWGFYNNRFLDLVRKLDSVL